MSMYSPIMLCWPTRPASIINNLAEASRTVCRCPPVQESRCSVGRSDRLLYDPCREGGYGVEGERDEIGLMYLVDRLNVIL